MNIMNITYQKNIILITSAINIESIFSPEERLLQTIQTINSLKKISNSYLILLEGSNLNKAQLSLLSSIVNKIVLFDSNFVLLDKSFGEAYMLYQMTNQLISESLQFDRLYKISGRYYLTDNFIEFGSNTKIQARGCVDKKITGVITTVMYSVPAILLNEYNQALGSSLHGLYNRKYSNIEHALYDILTQKDILQIIEKINVEGRCYSTLWSG